MSTEREAAFPVEDFMGVNRQVDREDLTHRQYWSLQNLWEKKLGLLETRPGTESHSDNLPSNIVGLDNIHRIYKGDGENQRVTAIQCQEDVQYLDTLPANMSMEFINNGGNWFQIIDADTWIDSESIVLRFIGYGVDYYYRVLANTLSFYGITQNSRLEIDISSAFTDENITGIEVYGVTRNGTIYGKVADPNYNEMTMWLGFIDLLESPTGTFRFDGGPISFRNGGAATTKQVGQRTFNITTSNQVGGTLEAGKTYYTMVLPHYFDSGVAGVANRRSCYRQPSVTIGGVTAITIPQGHNSITIDSISPATVSGIIAIGEDPQMLIPYVHTADTVAVGSYNINYLPKHSACVIDIKHTTASLSHYQFRHSDHSVRDMLININDDKSYEPVFCGRMHRDYQDEAAVEDYFVDKNLSPATPPGNTAFKYYENHDSLQYMGDGAKYDFTSWNNYSLFVNDYDPKTRENPGTLSVNTNFIHKSGTSYYITDGNIAAVVVHDYQGATEVRLPSGRFIKKFQESIIITGGDRVIDYLDGSVSDSSRTVFFSRAVNPFDFTVPGAGSPTHQFVTTEQGGEPHSGISLYTNTSGTSGPISQLYISKRSSSWLLTNLPEASGGAIPQTSMSNLSDKVGGFHKTMVNTPIGLISASSENVYLIRLTGEPAPVGDAISSIIQGADMSRASAVYHDEQYKISFHHPDYDGNSEYNNIEFWLDIKKMRAMKGIPSWKGPMIGRQIDYSEVEDLSGDGSTYNVARDRYGVDRQNLRVIKCDVTPHEEDTVVYDFNLEVESVLEMKDYEITKQDNNWNKLVKRTYWKVKTNRDSTNKLKALEYTYLDGDLAETQALEFYKTRGDFSTQSLKTFPFFPLSRIRGRTLRKKLSTKGRIGIGGFSLFYQIERRRI